MAAGTEGDMRPAGSVTVIQQIGMTTVQVRGERRGDQLAGYVRYRLQGPMVEVPLLEAICSDTLLLVSGGMGDQSISVEVDRTARTITVDGQAPMAVRGLATWS